MFQSNAGTEQTRLIKVEASSIPLSVSNNAPRNLMCVGTIVSIALLVLGIVNIIDGVNNSRIMQIVVGGFFVSCSLACFSSITSMAVKAYIKNKRMQSSQI
jgi:hypothetical protein